MYLPSAPDHTHVQRALRIILVAQCFLLLGAILQSTYAQDLIGFPYTPALLSLTHVLTLGWATLTCLGAVYQLLPVLLERQLAFPRLVAVSLWTVVAGSALFSWAFMQAGSLWLIAGGILLLLGLGGVVCGFAATLRAARHWDVTTVGIGLALVALTVQLLVGVFLVFNRRFNLWPDLGLQGAAGHAILGLLGWFSVLTMALSYRLLPMFTLSHGYRCRFRWLILGGTTLAAYAAWLAVWLHGSRVILGLAALVAGASAVLWLLDMYTIYQYRVRRKRDAVLMLFVSSGLALLFLSLLALVGVLGWWELQPAKHLQILFMVGFELWIGLAIITMLHKIIPFLVWIVRVAREAKPTLPATARELFVARLSFSTLGLYLLGAVLTVSGVSINKPELIQVGSSLIVGAVLGLFANTLHAWRCRRQPSPQAVRPTGLTT